MSADNLCLLYIQYSIVGQLVKNNVFWPIGKPQNTNVKIYKKSIFLWQMKKSKFYMELDNSKCEMSLFLPCVILFVAGGVSAYTRVSCIEWL